MNIVTRNFNFRMGPDLARNNSLQSLRSLSENFSTLLESWGKPKNQESNVKKVLSILPKRIENPDTKSNPSQNVTINVIFDKLFQ